MTQFHFLPQSDYQELRGIIDSISCEIGLRLEVNSSTDERGLTDELIFCLIQKLDKKKIDRYLMQLDVSKPSEKYTGSDILCRLIVKKNEIEYDRFILIQAKKYLTQKRKFNETEPDNTHLKKQIAKMHIYNPEFSYVLLYSANNIPKGNNISRDNKMKKHKPLLLKLLEQSLFKITRIYNNDIYPILFFRSKNWENLKNNKPEYLINHSETLSNLFLDDFLVGKIGKDWDKQIEKNMGEFYKILKISITEV